MKYFVALIVYDFCVLISWEYLGVHIALYCVTLCVLWEADQLRDQLDVQMASQDIMAIDS